MAVVGIQVKGVAFECGRSCGEILHKGDEAFIVVGEGQVICGACASKEGPR